MTRSPQAYVTRRAILVFAEEAGLHTRRRGLPSSAGSLLLFPSLAPEISPKADVHIFGARAMAKVGARCFHRQSGRSFSERLENAIELLSGSGYEEIVVVGRDCPELRANDIALAFEQLSTHDLVLGPDHRGGCYLIAFHARNRHLLRGVRWNRNTDCAELGARRGKSGVFFLPVKQDIDSWADVRLLAASGNALARLAAFLLKRTAIPVRTILSFVDLAAQSVRVRGQLPPPLAAR